MNMSLMGMLTALWLGILTSISPCPLATNICAISFISKEVNSKRSILLSGIMYTIGRTIVYLILGMIIVKGILSIPGMSHFLQSYINKFLGPMLIIVGMFLLEMLNINNSRRGISEKMTEKVKKHAILGAGLLGIVFALSFCPVTAALFFGSVIPLALKQNAILLLFFGVGTAVPVIVFAFVLAFTAQNLGKIFNKLSVFELWARRITGILLIVAGIYYCFVYIWM